MKSMSRLTIAAVLVGLLVVIATGVWAAPTFQGTVPNPPTSGQGTGGSGGVNVDLGTVVITSDCTDCTVTAEVADPKKLELPGISACTVMDTWCYATQDDGKDPVTEGREVFGDAFELKIEGTATVKVSFAFPPEFADKNAKIYKLDTTVTPPVWVEVVGAVVNADGTISVDVTEGGIYALIGDK